MLKREIPRNYVYYLETRVEQLEALLRSNNVPVPPSDDLEFCSKRPLDTEPGAAAITPAEPGTPQADGDHQNRLQKLLSNSAVAGEAADRRHLGCTTGISFARVVFAAVQSSVPDAKPTSEATAKVAGTSMRDSFFGLHTKPTIRPAPFPEKSLGLRLVRLYFEHANPQMPVLHKVNFMQMFEQAYAEDACVRGPKELYMLNMVFAIGGGIIMGEGVCRDGQTRRDAEVAAGKKQSPPEEYHASAIVHLEACLSNSGGGLDELQAVLLLASFALLRPVPPGLWYIIGVAVRLAIDLGLHFEEGEDIESGLEETSAQQDEAQTRERARREYVRDMRRRLWWCTYSFDRLVSVCVGRPVGIADQVMTTEFPSLLEDGYITTNNLQPAQRPTEPSYKRIAHHYFRLRLLQSEMLQVLQWQQAQMARAGGQNLQNAFIHKRLPSPFLAHFDSFRSWRIDIDKRLWEWKNAAPSRLETGVAFSTDFLDLNYWQSIIMLYRQSLSVPAVFEDEYHTSKEVNSPTVYSMELQEDKERVYVKVAEAGQKILRLHRSLHVEGLVNYTYLATHHLFMAGISYLYAIWHSPIVRSRLAMDEVDFTILAARSVFTDLIDKCPPAEACRDAFDRTAKATIKMANMTGGFGQQARQSNAMSNLVRSTDGASGLVSHTIPDQTTLSGADGFSLMRAVPAQPRSNASASDGPGTPAPTLDPSLQQHPQTCSPAVPAASAMSGPFPVRSPGQDMFIGGRQPEAPALLSPQLLGPGDFQGFGPAELDATQVDLGFGFGWEGMFHHDFSDGQQVDLFDGFFFGGQQGGGPSGPSGPSGSGV